MVKKKSPIDPEKTDKNFLAVSMPHRGTFQQELSHLFWRIELPDNYKPIYLAANSTDIVTARNSLVRSALKEDKVEYLLFIDSDQGVDPSVPRRLIEKAEENDISVLSALTFILQGGVPTPLLSSASQAETRFDWLDTAGLVETDSVGTGCLLVHRQVFEDIEGPPFEQNYDEDGIRTEAEDYVFSKKAQEAGYDLYIDQDVAVDHHKKVSLQKYLSVLSYAISVDDPEEFMEAM